MCGGGISSGSGAPHARQRAAAASEMREMREICEICETSEIAAPCRAASTSCELNPRAFHTPGAK